MPNNLRGTRHYLCGAIDRCPEKGKGWRDDITPFLKSYGGIVNNPLEKPIRGHKETPRDIELRYQKKLDGKYDYVAETMKEIRQQDLRMTDKSDVCICYLDLRVFAFGTVEEIVRMNMSKKPILVVVEQGKRHAPCWLYGMIPHQHIFSSWSELKWYLDQVDQTPIDEVETYGRWVFFDNDELIGNTTRPERKPIVADCGSETPGPGELSPNSRSLLGCRAGLDG